MRVRVRPLMGEKKDEAKKLSPKRKARWAPANFDWMQQCSKHLHHIEGRLMESEFLCHETIRQLQQLFLKCPPPVGDWAWLWRRAEDIAVRQVRQLARYYLRVGEDEARFIVRAMKVYRFDGKNRSP